VQEFIAEAKGTDLRCFVVGGKVVAAMLRTGPAGRVPLQPAPGRHAEKVKLTPTERATAVRAARAMGLNVAGVDLLRSNHGPLVLEVNASPGLEGIEAATGVDVLEPGGDTGPGAGRPHRRDRRPGHWRGRR
jgi:ribosomal protein S6--L-glutamate ligase